MHDASLPLLFEAHVVEAHVFEVHAIERECLKRLAGL
jgi:hypothetical protein